MEARKVRLAVAAVLFTGWIGWLAYLVVSTRDPVILSRPQFLVSKLWVIAEVKETSGRPAPQVIVQKVIWSASQQDQALAQTQITVSDLPFLGNKQGWDEPGEYILPLTKGKEDYQVTALPPAPGFVSAFRTVQLRGSGKKKDQVTELAVQVTGLGFQEARKRVEKLPWDMQKNVPWEDAEEIKKKFEDLGAAISLRHEESRIYRLTPQALNQLEEFRP